MSNAISQIRIKYIPSLFPSPSFVDTIYINASVIETPDYEIKIDKTKEKFYTVFNPLISDNINIQSIVYRKYYLEFIINLSIAIDLTKVADEVTIIDEYGSIFTASPISLEYEKQADTYIYQCKFEFYKLASDVNAISNYLTSTFLLLRTDAANLNKIVFTAPKDIDADLLSSETITFYTAINPIHSRSEMKILENEMPNGLKIESASFDSSNLLMRFYLTETEKNNLLKYANRCFLPDFANNPIATIVTDTTYTAIESIKIEIPQNDFVKIYEVNITLKYSQIDFYNYE